MLKHSSRGVTLIELVMAMVILGLVAIPMGAMIGAQIQGMMTSADLTAAGNLGRLEMERLHNLLYTDADLDVGTTPLPNYQGSLYNLTRTVAETTSGLEAMKNVTLTVQRAGTTPVLVRFDNTFCKNVSDGL